MGEYNTLVFTNAEQQIINHAQGHARLAWNHTTLQDVKSKIKQHYLDHPDFSRCCYCQKSFEGEFLMSIDIEHILPKGAYWDFRFTPLNLNVACKRCNMKIKRTNVDFIVDQTTIVANIGRSDSYYFVHPNLDVYRDHILIKSKRSGEYFINKYKIKTESKGRYTYDYFKLKELEINSIREAQGINKLKTLASNISINIRTRLQEKLEQLKNGY